MNIEKTISEHAVSDILTPMLESQDRIVTEDVAPLFDQATGLDTPPASGTVTTTIEESRSVITAIIRKAWTATLTMLGGASVISYIAAAYTYLRNRLQGSETYGIPDRRSEISASSPLAANLALLNDRKISEPNAIDGISLAQILCGTTETEEIYDNNSGWTMMRSLPTIPGLKKATIGCKSMPVNCGFTQAEEYVFPNLEALDNRASGWGGLTNVFGGGNIKKIVLPALKTLHCNNMNGNGFFYSLTSPCEIIMENCEYVYSWATNSYPMTFRNCSGVTKLVFGKLTTATNLITEGFTNLIHLEIGQDTAISLNLANWSPTLDSSNLQQFLQNFRDYIALRLTDNGSGKTLTLSQAVRNAIHAAEATYGIENIIITQKGWTISPAPN